MRPKSQYGRLGARGLIVPSHEVENFLANGWRLSDEPSCGIARMFPVAGGVNRVLINKKMGANRVQSTAPKRNVDNERFRTRGREKQARRY
jgi:hypothetical protein